MKKIISILIVLMAILFNSCEDWFPCLEGDGDIVTEERIGGSFRGVESEGEFDVRVEYAETTSVLVTTDENLQPYIETTIRNGKLIIKTDHEGCINFSSRTEVLIKTPNLTSIILTGSGNIEVYNFSPENFFVSQIGSGSITISSLDVEKNIEVNLIGSGNVWLKGRANSSKYILSGSGNIDSEAMRVFECVVNLSGSGNIHTYVYDLLQVSLSGSGSVYYYGNPEEVVKHVTGSGQVIDRSFNDQ